MVGRLDKKRCELLRNKKKKHELAPSKEKAKVEELSMSTPSSPFIATQERGVYATNGENLMAQNTCIMGRF